VLATSRVWIAENGRFDDGGISGATLDRPGLQRLVALVREDGTDSILVQRRYRLFRRVANCVKLFDECRRLRVNLVMVTAPELGNAAQDHFLLNIMASFAGLRREMIAGRRGAGSIEVGTEAVGGSGPVWLQCESPDQAIQFCAGGG
jgi:site-specific DNA recombinase